MTGHDSSCITYSLIDLGTGFVADSSIFSLDSVLREIYIYTVDLLKVDVYNLEL